MLSGRSPHRVDEWGVYFYLVVIIFIMTFGGSRL